MSEPSEPKRRIVSSRHLAEGEQWEASEVEYGMIIAYNAFSRWMTRCMSAAGNTDLTPLEILVLHNTNHRGRDKRLTDICFLLNIEDTHTVNYALRKLDEDAGAGRQKSAVKRCLIARLKPGQRCATLPQGRERCLVTGWPYGLTGVKCANCGTLVRSGQRQGTRCACLL